MSFLINILRKIIFRKKESMKEILGPWVQLYREVPIMKHPTTSVASKGYQILLSFLMPYLSRTSKQRKRNYFLFL